jgi:hypothetical protein
MRSCQKVESDGQRSGGAGLVVQRREPGRKYGEDAGCEGCKGCELANKGTHQKTRQDETRDDAGGQSQGKEQEKRVARLASSAKEVEGASASPWPDWKERGTRGPMRRRLAPRLSMLILANAAGPCTYTPSQPPICHASSLPETTAASSRYLAVSFYKEKVSSPFHDEVTNRALNE